MSVISIILLSLLVLSITVELILSRSIGKRTRWIRKLFWWHVKRSFIGATKKQNQSLLTYPMIAYLELSSEPKEEYISKGFEACKVVILNKLDEIFKRLTDPKERERIHMERINKIKQDIVSFREEYPKSKLSYDEILFIKQYEEAMKNSKA